MSAFDTDVLVVGAGPTGLTAAAELAARGVRCRIIDREAARSDKSRALVVQPRTLELFRRMGFADELISRGQPSLTINIHVWGKQVVHVVVDDIGIDDTPYPFILFISQAETEALLEEHLTRLGVRVERPVELRSYRDDGEGVTVELDGEGGPETVRARYLVGADGAHSTVRKVAGIPFRGDVYPQDFLLADVDANWEHPHGGVHLFFNRGGVFACVPMKGERAYRFITVRGKREAQMGDEPSLEEVRETGRRMTGTAFDISNPRWLARFRLHHRGVDRYRVGRIFVAGDAAHIHSPAGGQGMNTGIQDAFNLAWKLAFVVGRRAPDALLESYHAERYPVGKFLLRYTDRLFRLGSSSHPLLAIGRRLLIPRIAPRIFEDRDRRARAFRVLSQLAIHYRGSPIAHEPHERTGLGEEVRAGDRVPDVVLGDGSHLHDRIAATGFVLLVFGPATEREAIVAALGPWHEVVDVRFVERTSGQATESSIIDPAGRVRARFGVRDAASYLVRPDGHVATRSAGTGARAAREYLDRTLGGSST